MPFALTQNANMISLAINPDDLLIALRERNPQISSWLDRETGEIYQLSALFDDDEIEDDPAFVDAMQQTPIRFLRLPASPADIGFAAMREFVAMVTDPIVQAQLNAALARQRAFFHFSDALTQWPEWQGQWQALARTRLLEWAARWLHQQGISPLW